MTLAACEAPKNLDAVSELVGSCDRDGRKISIVGGNTLRGLGLPVERVDVTLSTASLADVVDYEPADLTIAAQAGIPIQNVAVLLAQHGQFIPFDAPRPHYATLGGTLAAGWLGPRRHVYGRPRDFLIGTTVVLADGSIARAGGMVTKNVAGYDMSRLYIGSFGTLCVLVRANLKTLAMPRLARAFVARLPERTRTRSCEYLGALPIRASAAFWIHGFHSTVEGEDGPEGRVFALLEGSPALLERATRELRSALGRAGVPETRVVDAGSREAFQRIVDAYVASLGERSVTYRIFSLPERSEQRALAVHDAASRFGLRCETLVDVNNGDIVARVSDLDSRSLGAKMEAFDDALHAVEPSAEVVACDHPRRTDLRVWGDPPPAIERMRELKRRFDPNRTLNPGRFVGGI
jgi:glycolate oxidase FAD binding subunit